MKRKPKEKVFEQLIDQELPKLRAMAYRILNNAADTDDAIQEALLKAWERYESFRNESALSIWVCRIVINCSYDILRKQMKNKNSQCVSQEEPGEDTTTARLADDDLRLAIAELPEPYRDALTLGVLSGMDGRQAARQLEISTNTLYQRIFKAKQMLKNTLKEENA